MNLSNHYPFIFAALIALIGLEFFFHRKEYRFHESVSNLMTGVSYLCFEAYFRIFSIFAYVWCLGHLSIFKLPYTLPVWAGTFLIYDFMIYCNHRLSHRSNLFWAAHIGHHQSEHLNTGAAVRVTIGNRFFYFPPVLLLAVIGIPLEIFVIVNTFVGLYPILTHTPLTGRLKGIERILVTPSHHRVHHGKNPEYVDRNFSSVLSIWDYLFGSYEPEVAKANFGVSKKMPYLSVYGSQFLQFGVVWAAIREAKGLNNILRQAFGPPEKLKISDEALDRLYRSEKKHISHPPHSPIKIVTLGLLSFVFTIYWILPGHAPEFSFASPLGHLAVVFAFICAWYSARFVEENET